MIEFAIRIVLKGLAGVTAEQWQSALSAVIRAAKFYKESHDKRKYFQECVSSFLTGTTAIDLVRSLAVIFARKKGLIQ